MKQILSISSHGHISRFTPITRTVALLFTLSLSTIILAGCGNLQWPPPGYGRQDGSSSVPVTINNAAFVNATAVTVGAGDTVYALSRRHHVSQRDIIIANNLKPPYLLTIGQRIILPRGQEHAVIKGDTLSLISRTYNVNMYDLARANNINPPYTIYVGQKLRLPGTGAARTTVASTLSESSSSASTQSSTQESQIPATAPTMQTASTSTTATQKTTRSVVPSPPAATGDGFIWPVRGRVISSFGAKDKGMHNDGINIAAPEGSPVQATENGVVAYAGNELRGFGNLILIKHANGYVSAYAHTAKILVKRGDKISKGQPIATVGKTGNVGSSQLHFEIRKGKKALDPKSIMPPLSA